MDNSNQPSYLLLTQEILMEFAIAPFVTEVLPIAFGDDFDFNQAQTLFSQWAVGDWSSLPEIVISSELGGANRDWIEKPLHEAFGDSIWLFSGTPFGLDILTASIVLAIMIIPTELQMC